MRAGGSKGQEEEEQTAQTEKEPPERWLDHWQDPQPWQPGSGGERQWLRRLRTRIGRVGGGGTRRNGISDGCRVQGGVQTGTTRDTFKQLGLKERRDRGAVDEGGRF